MVHYIRYLSPPQVFESHKKVLTVSAVVAITTDLGDAFLGEDVDLAVRLVQTKADPKVVSEQHIGWKGSSRALKVALVCPAKYAARSVRMHVAISGTATFAAVPKILDVWSMSFELANKRRAEPLVDREMLLANNANLTIREETGDSIAKHIWDASLGFLMYLDPRTLKLSAVGALFDSSTCKPIQILELGAGCGIVGIAFAQMLNCDVLLTDLEAATETLQTNIKLASIKSGSTLQAEVLDWSSGLHESLNAKYDLVILSDCIYNPDSSIHLVETLQRLAQSSPHVLVLVGFKRRHHADDIFFDRMQAAEFEILETTAIDLPHRASEFDVTSPNIEFYTYRPPI